MLKKRIKQNKKRAFTRYGLDNKIKSDINRFLEKKVVENETLFNRFSNEFVETELAGFNLLHQEFKENKNGLSWNRT